MEDDYWFWFIVFSTLAVVDLLLFILIGLEKGFTHPLVIGSTLIFAALWPLSLFFLLADTTHINLEDLENQIENVEEVGAESG